MARILVHAMAATAGGGVTYLRQLLTHLAEQAQQHHWTILVPSDERIELPQADHLSYRSPKTRAGGLGRLWFDQASLRRVIDNERIDLILATANFGMIRPPVPQVLLNRNALYFSPEHIRELHRRRDFRTLLTTLARRQIAISSIRSSIMNIVPTRAFAEQIADSIGSRDTIPFEVNPFGFDHDGFAHRRQEPGRQAIESRLLRLPGVRRVLLVSHYNYFRNFDTLLRAVAILHARRQELRLPPMELILTTRLAAGLKFHRYDTTSSATLVERLGIQPITTMLGSVSHQELPHLYDLADVVVCPSYAESFGHPMVEAMACGRPIVAADRNVHREVCGSAALYFSTFDPEQLAFRISQILDDQSLAHRLADQGRQRAQSFQWPSHFARLMKVIDQSLALSTRTHSHA
jgi:glycosyltransferase involved in cell wall biosynthesis